MIRNRALGSLWMLAAGILFAVMGVTVKLGAARYTTPELVFYRSVLGFALILAFTLVRKQPLATAHLKLHLSRSFFGFVALGLFFYAITTLPLATAITLNYTSPLFLAIFTTFVLRKRVRPELGAAILLGFIGVFLLLNPTFHGGSLLSGVLGLLSGLFAGFVYMQVAQLGQLGEPEWRTVFYFTAVCSACSALWMTTQPVHTPAIADIPLLLGMGASATLAQLAMTRAYSRGDALVSGSLAYTTVIFASLLGIWLWDETLSLSQWLAVALIVASGVVSVHSTHRQS